MLRYGNGGYAVDMDGVIGAIRRHSGSRFPMRLMGFPSYTYFLLREMETRGIQVKLKEGSKILLGGGWKQFITERVDKSVLYELAHRVLGIEETDICLLYTSSASATHLAGRCFSPSRVTILLCGSHIIVR